MSCFSPLSAFWATCAAAADLALAQIKGEAERVVAQSALEERLAGEGDLRERTGAAPHVSRAQHVEAAAVRHVGERTAVEVADVAHGVHEVPLHTLERGRDAAQIGHGC